MLQIKSLNYTIGQRQLIKDLDAVINPGKRVALIGRNGAGKTTLLNILTGRLEPDSGNIMHPVGYQIGYLPQEQMPMEGATILQSVLSGHAHIMQMEIDIEDLQEKIAHDPSETLLHKLGSLQEQFELKGGYQLESQAKALLSGLGFHVDDFARHIGDFSGGWRMRVYLARLLLLQPDLLLLDEPTNHLDLESLEWLEQYLKTFPGSMLIVSHDRYFIDRLADEIFELDRGKLTLYAGNYSFYEQKKAEDEALLLKRIEEQQAERERIQKFISRFRYKASKASQVQSRVKLLEKMEILEPPDTEQRLNFSIETAVNSYKDVLKIRDLHFKYPESDWVLRDINLDIFRGEKIALVGVNGAGKTTLTRLMYDQLSPQKGSVELGGRTHAGYYAQHQTEALNLANTVIDEVAETAADSHRTRLRDILGIFQFSGDDARKRIRVLSGGEKARVSLAKILLSLVNFLIMDEPTNHLDMVSQAALEKALREYNGTLLLISHDRYFLDRLVSRVLELKDGHLKVFEGNYSEYLQRREQQAALAGGDNGSLPDPGPQGKKSKEQKRQEAQARQRISQQRKTLERELQHCENELERHESSKVELEASLADPEVYKDGQKAAKLQKDYAEVQSKIAGLLERWEKAQSQYEELLAKL